MSAAGLNHDEASRRVAALYQPRWLRHYAASKLRRDPIFRAAFELLRESTAPILDIGCGIGLLPFYLRERSCAQPVVGLEIDQKKLAHARLAASSRGYQDVTFLEQDAVGELPEFCGNVTLFDVLHYLPASAQGRLLKAVALHVAPDAMVLIRDCLRDGSARFYTTYFAERFAQLVSWNLNVPLQFPTREMIAGAFSASEFSAEERPMWGSGPLNNRLFIFRRRPSATARASE